MAVEQGPLSGFRDMLAEQMIPRQAMIQTIQAVYESYGFVPLKTPALERFETVTGKYGEEGDKLMYSFKDNGDRHVALRYDQTVPLARVVGQHGGNLPSPYKRYTVGEAWRGESPQAGRFREFTQFDADIVGTTSPMADAEIVGMMSDAMKALGADALIRVNNRLILDALAEKAGAQTKEASLGIITTIDKVDKIGIKAVLGEISTQYGEQAAEAVRAYLAVDGTPFEKLAQVEEILAGTTTIQAGIDNLKQVFTMLDTAGYPLNAIVFDQTIARGLSYYTGIIYETSLVGAESLGSVCSGGRFDNLVATLGGPDMPAVGTSIGVDRLYEGLKQLGLLEEKKTNTQVLVANFSNEHAAEYMRVAADLRRSGIPTELYYEDAKLGKQIRFADKMNIPYVVLIGPDELAHNLAVVKDLASGDQASLSLDQLADKIKERTAA